MTRRTFRDLKSKSLSPHERDIVDSTHTEILNVRAKGALGDGKSDDAPWTQIAIDELFASGGGEVMFPQGTFILGKTINLKANVRLRGQGQSTVLKMSDDFAIDTNLLQIDAQDNVSIENLTLDGNSTPQIGTTDQALVLLTHANGTADNLLIRGCLFRDAKVTAIRLGSFTGSGASNARILDNTIIHAGSGHALRLNREMPHATISGNYIDGTGSDSDANCIFVGQDSDYAVIADNHVLNAGDMGIEYWTNALGGATISGNIIENAALFGISVSASPNCAVTGNYILGGTTCIEIAVADFCAVTGNTMEDPSDRGVIVNKASFCAVTGNTVKRAGVASPDAAIVVFADNSNTPFIASHNLISDNNIELPATGDVQGIYLFCNHSSAEISYNLVTNNKIFGAGASNSKGILATNSGTMDGNVLQYNHIYDVVRGIDDRGDTTTIGENIFISTTTPYFTNGPVGVFTDQDATPDVSALKAYKTANTIATTITDLDGGTEGDVTRVIINDANTTIDFTASGLKGNAGVNWSPGSGDHMTCTYDGTDWFCDVSDNTA